MYGCSLHKWLELVAPLGGEQGRLLPRGHCRRAPSQNYLQGYSAITKDQFTLMRQKITPWAPLQYKGQCVPWYHQGLITKYRSLNFIRCEALLGPLFKIGNSPIGHRTSTDIFSEIFKTYQQFFELVKKTIENNENLQHLEARSFFFQFADQRQDSGYWNCIWTIS